MARKKAAPLEVPVDQKTSEFLSFKESLKSVTMASVSKNKKSIHVSTSGSDIAHSIVAMPPHFEMTKLLFPAVSVDKFIEIAAEIYKKGHSDVDEIPDYYDTHYFEYTFDIDFVDLYRIYLKHQ